MNADRINAITKVVIGRAFIVSNTLGCGFLEKIYERALAFEVQEAGLSIRRQYDINVYYKDAVIGTYTADLFVEESVLVELKAVKALDPVHEAQCMNYLKASRLPLCLLLNFGNPRVEIKRIANGI